METFSALLALFEGNPPVTGGFPSKRPVTQTFYASFNLRLNTLAIETQVIWGVIALIYNVIVMVYHDTMIHAICVLSYSFMRTHLKYLFMRTYFN